LNYKLSKKVVRKLRIQIQKKAVARVLGITAGSALGLLLAGCNYYKEQRGFLTVRSEAFSHHYEGSPCGLQGKSACDLSEIRYTFIHKGVKVVAHCQ
jgi:hypothetical protein